jgi:hypothetical protein
MYWSADLSAEGKCAKGKKWVIKRLGVLQIQRIKA